MIWGQHHSSFTKIKNRVTAVWIKKSSFRGNKYMQNNYFVAFGKRRSTFSNYIYFHIHLKRAGTVHFRNFLFLLVIRVPESVTW